MENTNKRMALLLVFTASLLLLLIVVVIGGNRKEVSIQLDKEIYEAEWGEDFTAPVAKVFLKVGWGAKTQVQQEVQCVGTVDVRTPGNYTLTYSAELEGKKAEKTVTVAVQDTKAPVIQLVGGNEVIVRPGATYEEQGYTAEDNRDGDITSKVKTTVSPDKIVYTVTDASGNETNIERAIVYRDIDGPVVTLLGDSEVLLEVDATYEEKGATAMDETDGDVTANITVTGSVDTRTPGAYEIKYTVKDAAGNVGEATRIVRVRDTEAPVLTLAGEKKLYIKRGEAYAEPGYTAVDSIEGDMAARVTVEGEVDTEKLGVYTLTYKVQDSFGNEATEQRDVIVYIQQANVDAVDPGNKVIYLTFDDGPYKYTQELLDILAKYNVKVTFFVTSQFPGYLDMIKKCSDAGHTIALHTYGHDYYEVYAGTTQYFNDLQKIADVVKKQTGTDASIIRFPGGSSNTINKKKLPGLMTTLTKQVQEVGYKYVDWNVDSKDSDGKSCKLEMSEAVQYVADATISGIKSRRGQYSIVLQHDIHLFSVRATEKIILWGLENGYTFLPMTDESPMWHHGLNN